MATAQDILNFWFEEHSPKDWFASNAEFDQKIEARFGTVLAQAAKGELAPWRTDVKGRLAEIIVLDQFSRNVYRATPRAFAQDSMALVLAQEMVLQGMDKTVKAPQLAFVYLPFMHSESLLMQEESVRLYKAAKLENNIGFAEEHRDIIKRFGRFPHRNSVLGRTSTAEELKFMETHKGF